MPSHRSGALRAHYFLGLVLRQMGDLEWAIKEFEIAQMAYCIKVKCFRRRVRATAIGSASRAIVEFERGIKIARREAIPS